MMVSGSKYQKIGFAQIDDDLNFLLDCLREVLEHTGESSLVEYLPWRAHDEPGRRFYPPRLGQLYAIGFQLLNTVEECVATRMRRLREVDCGPQEERGLWPHTFAQLKKKRFSAQQIKETLERIHIEPVLTAHPTEAKRPTVLERHREIYVDLIKYANAEFTPFEKKKIRQRIVSNLETLWRTGEILVEKPDISQELLNAIYYLREVFPVVVTRLDNRLEESWAEDKTLASSLLTYPRISFGTWIGGDRDGHPLVTAEVTRNSLSLLRQHALTLYRKQLREIGHHFTLSQHRQVVSRKLLKRIRSLAEELDPRQVADILERNREEPWRQFLFLVRVKITNGIRAVPGGYSHPEEFASDLAIFEQSLREIRAEQLIEQYLHPLQRQLKVFGFHLASLDIRQNSAYHDRAMQQILRAAGVADGEYYASWPEAKRLEFLRRELSSPRPFLPPDSSVGEEGDNVLSYFRVIHGHYRRWGMNGLGSYIVSMTRDVSDLLVVYLFAREVGFLEGGKRNPHCPMEVVPLFETLDDLERSPRVMESFLNYSWVKRALAKRGNHPVQQVMLGYSDSNKDCGIFSSQWGLHCAQRDLSAIADAHGIAMRFFHGRGGTISRGAGPTHWFMHAMPPGALSGSFRMTEQGETIAQKYANHPNATYNLELLLASATYFTAAHQYRRAVKGEPLDDIIEEIARCSQQSYGELLGESGFIDFYRQATPIDALEHSRIGSRPARRTGQKTLADLRAIPWVFSWTQARFYLPGWYGVGSALEMIADDAPEIYARLRQDFGKSSFLRYTLTNIETNLASANAEIMTQYAALVGAKALREKFLKKILAEYYRTEKFLHDLLGSEIDKRRPRMIKTLRMREAPLDILHHQQLVLLRRWRNLQKRGEFDQAEALYPEIQLSINAIASGLRTTG